MTRGRVAVVAAAVMIAAAVGWFGRQASASAPAAASSTVPTATAPVVRTDLATTTQVQGTLGYSGSYTVLSQLSGTALTAMAALGTIVTRGQALFEVDGTGVPLLYGSRPMWRTIAPGVAPGPDVFQLDQNLIAFGDTDGGYLSPSDSFTAATAAAIEEWQLSNGEPVTGSVQLGAVEFLPGPIRVDSQTAVIGAPVQPGAQILTATSVNRAVDAQVPVTQEYLISAGDHVTVTLPDGVTTTPGTITAIAPVVTTQQAAGGSAAGQGGGGGNGSGGSGQSSGSGPATVDVTVSLADPAAAGQYDQAPVEVNITDDTAENVLAVPINSLVALAGGGYGVYLVAEGRQTLIAVRTGLFAGTLVQVSGPGLQEGLRVEVPTQ